MIKLKKILQEKRSVNETVYKFNGKTLEEWIKILGELPYDDMIEASSLSGYDKTEDLLRIMKKKAKYI